MEFAYWSWAFGRCLRAGLLGSTDKGTPGNFFDCSAMEHFFCSMGTELLD